jgi:ATP-binding cassette subfamily F protein 3
MSNRMLLNIKNLSFSLLDRTLFTNLSFSIEKGSLLALIGPNGCGKSTILEAIVAEAAGVPFHPDDPNIRLIGEIYIDSAARLTYLPQSLREHPSTSGLLDSKQEESGSREAKLRADFGLSQQLSESDAVSDGELQKRALIAAMLQDRDIYLLDEPTNYLDIRGITAVEEHLHQLKSQGKGILIVTHDRTLADNLADETLLISHTDNFRVPGGATAAWSALYGDIESREKRAKDIKKKIRQLQDDVRAKSGWASTKERQIIGGGSAKGHISKLSKKMAKRAKAVQQRVEREMDRLEETKPFIPKRLNLAFPEYQVRNRQVFSLQKVGFSYEGPGSPPLFSGITLAVGTRERICLMGSNGSGKSTILKLARNVLRPTEGESRANKGVKTAYVPQGLTGFFEQRRLLDNFIETGCDETTIRRFLGSALIRKDKPEDLVANFSYGELMRAAIVKCILSQAEFLFLDEPTSHLDIESIEVLEQLLTDFPGGFLLISHDRTFVENTADQLYLLEDGHLRLV